MIEIGDHHARQRIGAGAVVKGTNGGWRQRSRRLEGAVSIASPDLHLSIDGMNDVEFAIFINVRQCQAAYEPAGDIDHRSGSKSPRAGAVEYGKLTLVRR